MTAKTPYERRLEASRRWKEKNRQHTRDYANRRYRDNTTSFEGYTVLLSDSAKRRTKDSDITPEYLQELPRVCALTGKSFEYENRFIGTFSNPLAPSIDRINPKVGYYKGNVQLVLNCINKMRNDMSVEDFKSLWKELQS